MSSKPRPSAGVFRLREVVEVDLMMKILAVVAGVMMLFFLWPAYKHWSANSPKAEKVIGPPLYSPWVG